MTSQMRTLMLGLGIMLMIAHNDFVRPFNNFLDVFCWIGYLLVAMVVVLWPVTGKDERARKKSGSPRWASRIDFEAMGR